MSAEQVTADPAVEALRIARELFEHSPDWVVFHRKIFGADGILAELFPKPEELRAFRQTDAHFWITERVRELRQRAGKVTGQEKTTVITVRLPESMHKALRDEAHDRRTSLNQLCISKLLQTINADLATA